MPIYSKYRCLFLSSRPYEQSQSQSFIKWRCRHPYISWHKEIARHEIQTNATSRFTPFYFPTSTDPFPPSGCVQTPHPNPHPRLYTSSSGGQPRSPGPDDFKRVEVCIQSSKKIIGFLFNPPIPIPMPIYSYIYWSSLFYRPVHIFINGKFGYIWRWPNGIPHGQYLWISPSNGLLSSGVPCICNKHATTRSNEHRLNLVRTKSSNLLRLYLLLIKVK